MTDAPAGAVRYRRLGYLALNVTDLDRSASFYRDVVGLHEVSPSRQASIRYLRCGSAHHDIVLYEGRPGLKRIGFELERDSDLERLRHRLSSHSQRWIETPVADRAAMRTGRGIRAWEPVTGCALDFYATMEAGRGGDGLAGSTRIDRLGHVVLRSADAARSVAFFRDILNFEVSDEIEDRVTFMRCFPNPLHHSLGVSNGAGVNGLHHVNFMVGALDEVGKAYWRFDRMKVPVVNGPGRHLPSGSVFLYFLDPDDLTLEYSFGMEEFPEIGPREPRKLRAAPTTFDLWGSRIDPRKAATGEIEVGAD